MLAEKIERVEWPYGLTDEDRWLGTSSATSSEALLSGGDVRETPSAAAPAPNQGGTVVSVRSRGRVFRAEFDAPLSDLPIWLFPTIEALAGLLELEPGWDSYDAPAIDFRIVVPALRTLAGALRNRTPPPSVVPTVQGGVQFEWHTGGVDLEIEINPADQVEVLCEYLDSGESWEGGLPQVSALLRQAIERLG